MPVSAVERVLRLAAWTPLPGAARGVVGVEPERGGHPGRRHAATIRLAHTQSFGRAAPRSSFPGQHRYALWADDVEEIRAVPAHAFDSIGGGDDRTEAALAPFADRLDDGVLPVLAPEALDPGADRRDRTINRTPCGSRAIGAEASLESELRTAYFRLIEERFGFRVTDVRPGSSNGWSRSWSPSRTTAMHWICTAPSSPAATRICWRCSQPVSPSARRTFTESVRRSRRCGGVRNPPRT